MYMPSHAGWFDDPADPNQLRYFDGVIWTSHTAPRVTRPPAGAPWPGEQAMQGQGEGSSQSPSAPSPPPSSGGWSAPYGSAGQQAPYGRQQGPANPQFPGAPQPGQWNAPTYGGALTHRNTTPDGQPLASYGQRAGAFLVDWAIQLAISLALGFPFLVKAFSGYVDSFQSMMSQAEAGQQPDITDLMNSIDRGQLVLYSLVSIVVFLAYQLLFLTRTGQTPGKRVVGISVRLRERPGVPSADVVLRRLALPVGLFLIQLVPLVGTVAQLVRLLDLLWPAWDEKKQALHDKVSGTNVVVGRQPPR